MRFLNCQGRESPSLSCKLSNNRMNAVSLLSLLYKLIAPVVGLLVLTGFSMDPHQKIRVRGTSYQSRAVHKICICGEQFASSSMCYLLIPVTEAGISVPYEVLCFWRMSIHVQRLYWQLSEQETLYCTLFFTPTMYCSGTLRLSCWIADSRWSWNVKL